jgi:hypothetical protein
MRDDYFMIHLSYDSLILLILFEMHIDDYILP